MLGTVDVEQPAGQQEHQGLNPEPTTVNQTPTTKGNDAEQSAQDGAGDAAPELPGRPSPAFLLVAS